MKEEDKCLSLLSSSEDSLLSSSCDCEIHLDSDKEELENNENKTDEFQPYFGF